MFGAYIRFLFNALAVICCTSALADEAPNNQSVPAVETERVLAEDAANVFGNWKNVCSDDGTCRIAQSIVTSGTQEPLLVARVFKTPKPVMVITVPSGIYLAPGLAIQIDGGKRRRYPFETCDSDGCHTGVKLDTSLIKEAEAGAKAKVSFFDGTQKVATVVLSLDGFSKGYKALR